MFFLESGALSRQKEILGNSPGKGWNSGLQDLKETKSRRGRDSERRHKFECDFSRELFRVPEGKDRAAPGHKRMWRGESRPKMRRSVLLRLRCGLQGFSPNF